MSPPAAIFESPAPAVLGNGVDLKKKLAVKAASVVQDGQANTVAEFEGNWDNFTFAPIRESQVSRAMSTSSVCANDCPVEKTDVI